MDELDLIPRIVEHWREYCPSLYRELESTGELTSEAEITARNTIQYAERLQEQGYGKAQAESEAMREVALQVFR
jgi:hypothetical protein